MGAQALYKVPAPLVPSKKTANLFETMRRVNQSTRPWAKDLITIAIRFPEEPLTAEESLEIARQTGERRLLLNAQAQLALNNKIYEETN